MLRFPISIVSSESYCDLIIEPPRGKTNKMTCAPSEDSDQPWQSSMSIWIKRRLSVWETLRKDFFTHSRNLWIFHFFFFFFFFNLKVVFNDVFVRYCSSGSKCAAMNPTSSCKKAKHFFFIIIIHQLLLNCIVTKSAFMSVLYWNTLYVRLHAYNYVEIKHLRH